MNNLRINEDDFLKDENGRTILKTSEDISKWVKLKFEEQKAHYKNDGLPFELNIDLSNCILSSYCRKNEDGSEIKIFNLCELADIVEGITKIDKNGYRFEISENIDFSNSVLHGAFFHYVIFKRRVNFSGAKIISGTSSFFQCIFHDYASFDKVDFPGSVSFTNTVFKKYAYFQESKFDGHFIEFSNVKFESDFFARGIEFTSEKIDEHCYFRFISCDFLGDTHLSNIIFPQYTTFKNCFFQNETTFTSSSFNETLSFHNCKIDGIMLFNRKDDKENGKGKNKNQFKNLVFWSSKIEGEIHFEYCDIKKTEFCFSKIKSNGRVRFSMTSIEQMNFAETTVDGRMDIIECTILKLNMEASIIAGFINTNKSKINEVEDRYTARVLKNEAIKVNDTISALNFKQMEMEKYRIDLKNNFHWNKEITFIQYLKQLPVGRLILLYFSKYSNGYGLKWGRGVCFTVIWAAIFFFLINYFGMDNRLFVIDFKFNNFGAVWKGFLEVLNVLNFKEKLNGFELNAIGETFFLISKIFLSYGIYQTVAAFRKYGSGNGN